MIDLYLVQQVTGVLLIMGLITLWRKLRKGRGISILIPFRSPINSCYSSVPTDQRSKNCMWVKKYWKTQLPGAEVIIGHDPFLKLPFSKSVAVNNAVAKSKGDILVIADADGYFPAELVLHCAQKIRKARKKGQRLWYVPYRQFYRLTEEASMCVLTSSPDDPYQFSTPPPPSCILDCSGSQHGHWYGAGIQIMPREAYEEVGGWDPRFRGWGGEDHAAMRAMDTLYWPHKTLPGQFLHLWHPMMSPTGVHKIVHWSERMWENQTATGANDDLSGRYYGATGDRKRMRKLVNEWRFVDAINKTP